MSTKEFFICIIVGAGIGLLIGIPVHLAVSPCEEIRYAKGGSGPRYPALCRSANKSFSERNHR